jgi:hypothetical protein
MLERENEIEIGRDGWGWGVGRDMEIAREMEM